MTMTLVPGFRFQAPHPYAGRDAYQCSRCSGISHPDAPGAPCPYCAEREDEEIADRLDALARDLAAAYSVTVEEARDRLLRATRTWSR